MSHIYIIHSLLDMVKIKNLMTAWLTLQVAVDISISGTYFGDICRLTVLKKIQ